MVRSLANCEDDQVFDIGWATDADLIAVAGDVPIDRAIKDVLDDWRAVTVCYQPDGLPYADQKVILGMHLVGVPRARGRTFCTSPVERIDLGAGRTRTASGSLYLLADEAGGPVPEQLVFGLLRHLLLG